MRIATIASLLVALLLATSAAADPIPRFTTPGDLLDSVYGQIVAGQDWETFDADAAYAETDAFSAGLSAQLARANEILLADGNEMGALDFSPFIHGQDASGMSFDIGTPKVKGDRATATVNIMLDSKLLHIIGFELINESAGWKVDDMILPDYSTYTAGATWRLSDYLADPLAYQ
jgi:hypothetical protein